MGQSLEACSTRRAGRSHFDALLAVVKAFAVLVSPQPSENEKGEHTKREGEEESRAVCTIGGIPSGNVRARCKLPFLRSVHTFFAVHSRKHVPFGEPLAFRVLRPSILCRSPVRVSVSICSQHHPTGLVILFLLTGQCFVSQ